MVKKYQRSEGWGRCRVCGYERQQGFNSHPKERVRGFYKAFKKVSIFRGDDELMDCVCEKCFKPSTAEGE